MQDNSKYLFGTLAERFAEAGIEQGWPRNPDFNGAEHEGFGSFAHTIYKGHRQSTSTAFIKPIMWRNNLTIMDGTMAHKLILENGKCKGVKVSRSGRIRKRQETTEIRAKEVILSGGAFNSPQVQGSNR